MLLSLLLLCSESISAPPEVQVASKSEPCQKIGNIQVHTRQIPDEPEQEFFVLPATAKCAEVEKAITKEFTANAVFVGAHGSYAAFSFMDYQTRVGILDTNSGVFVRFYDLSLPMESAIPKQTATLTDGILSIHGVQVSKKECASNNLGACTPSLNTISLPPSDQFQCPAKIQEQVKANGNVPVQLEGIVEINLNNFTGKATQVLCYIPS